MHPGQTPDFSSLRTDSTRDAACRGGRKAALGARPPDTGHLPSPDGWDGGVGSCPRRRRVVARAPVGKGSLPCGTRPQYGCQGHASGPATRPLLRLLLGPCTHRRGGKGKPSSTTFRLKATLQQSLGAQFPKNPHSRWVRKQPAVSPSCRLPPTFSPSRRLLARRHRGSTLLGRGESLRDAGDSSWGKRWVAIRIYSY